MQSYSKIVKSILLVVLKIVLPSMRQVSDYLIRFAMMMGFIISPAFVWSYNSFFKT